MLVLKLNLLHRSPEDFKASVTSQVELDAKLEHTSGYMNPFELDVPEGRKVRWPEFAKTDPGRPCQTRPKIEIKGSRNGGGVDGKNERGSCIFDEENLS